MYHKRNKSEPLGSSLISPTLFQLKNSEPENHDHYQWGTLVNKTPSGSLTIQTEDPTPAKARFFRKETSQVVQTLKPDMRLDLSKITKQSVPNYSMIGTKKEITSTLRTNDQGEFNKEVNLYVFAYLSARITPLVQIEGLIRLDKP